jgi:hypothetical protein
MGKPHYSVLLRHFRWRGSNWLGGTLGSLSAVFLVVALMLLCACDRSPAKALNGALSVPAFVATQLDGESMAENNPLLSMFLGSAEQRSLAHTGRRGFAQRAMYLALVFKMRTIRGNPPP